MQDELNSAPPSDSLKYVLKWDFDYQDYLTSDCNPLLSNNRITVNHMNLLLEMLRKNPNYKTPRLCPLLFGVFGLFILIMLVIILLFTIVKSQPITKIAISAVLLIIAFGIILTANIWNMKKRRERLVDLGRIVQSASNTIFRPLQASAQLSRHAAYIIIHFDSNNPAYTSSGHPYTVVYQQNYYVVQSQLPSDK